MRISPLTDRTQLAFGMTSAPIGSAPAMVSRPADSVHFGATSTVPKFGCRLFAYMAAPHQPQQNKLLTGCLLNGHNSLRDQSKPRQPELDHDLVYSWDELPALPVNDDGWGIATYSDENGGDPRPVLTKRPDSAALDSRYETTVKNAIARKPGVLMAHVRYATVGGNNTDNTHPFSYGPWTFMHNGGVYGKVMDDIRERVRTDYAPRLGHGPLGQTDSEAVFYYFLGKLSERYPQADLAHTTLEDVPPSELLDTFAGVVGELLNGQSEQRDYPLSRHRIAKLTGLRLTEESRMQVAPACNYVVSNGNVLMASAFDHKIYLGTYQKPVPFGRLRHHPVEREDLIAGNTAVVLASETMQPKGLLAGKIRWIEVPSHHCVLLERTPDGVRATMKAL